MWLGAWLRNATVLLLLQGGAASWADEIGECGWAANAKAGWATKYVSEGRDNLGSGGLFFAEAGTAWQDFSAGFWAGSGDDETYTEVKMGVGYGVSVGSVDLSFGYTRLEFPADDESDNEIATGLVVNNLPGGVTPNVDYTYATEAEGGFLSIWIEREVSLSGGRLVLLPYVLQAFDFGFATPAHDGENHVEIGVDAAIPVADGVSLAVGVYRTFAQTDVKREDLGDETWASLAVAADF